ncbi:MAG: 3-isopropylmalate dehydratase small subunit [Deltaproteobacteria bacterium]|nr:3-isopropylmalate dehydratase small subunit [Deltaproteobacteria bacterium]
MRLTGKVWKFGDNIDTDVIIPARHLTTFDPKELASHCMEDKDPSFAQKVKPGDIIVAGRNFGCGSSREHAPIAIKGCGLSCVVARSFARIFFRNAFNMGLLIFECPEVVDAVEEGDTMEIDVASGKISIVGKGLSFSAQPIPPFMQELLRDGGLIPHIMKKVKKA